MVTAWDALARVWDLMTTVWARMLCRGLGHRTLPLTGRCIYCGKDMT